MSIKTKYVAEVAHNSFYKEVQKISRK